MTNFYFNKNTLDQSYLSVMERTTGHMYTGLEKYKLLHEWIISAVFEIFGSGLAQSMKFSIIPPQKPSQARTPWDTELMIKVDYVWSFPWKLCIGKCQTGKKVRKDQCDFHEASGVKKDVKDISKLLQVSRYFSKWTFICFEVCFGFNF